MEIGIFFMTALVIRGAREHNLKNVSCELPRARLVCISGPSGSGKSSLAFDTLYAEGQRRYVESLSVYARQFLDQLPKPDVDSIEGLSPAIAIEQKGLGKGPRSTVGTVTEIADYLRVLFARVGTPHCPHPDHAARAASGEAGTEPSDDGVLRAHTVQDIVDTVLDWPVGTKVVVLAPVTRRQKGGLARELEALRREGYVRVRVDGEMRELGDEIHVDAKKEHELDVVVDRLIVKPGLKGRLTDSVELALKLARGTVLFDRADGSEPLVMSDRLVCWEHNVTLPPLEPRLFSFNTPHGACPTCNGLGIRTRIDPDRVVPDGALTLRDGAILGLGRPRSVAMATELAALVKALKVDADTRWEKLPKPERNHILYGKTTGKRIKYEGVIARLEALLEGNDLDDGREPADGAITAEDLNRFCIQEQCDACHGSRLRPEALAVTIDGENISALGNHPLTDFHDRLLGLLSGDSLPPAKAQIAKPLLQSVCDRAGFLIQVGLGYLALNRPTATLSGGEGQRIRLATQIGAALVGVLYVLDEPSVGLHARDTEQLLDALRRLVERDNSVIVVEHDRDVILAADHVVDMGPAAGKHGGEIVAQGSPQEIIKDPNSLTGAYLSNIKQISRSQHRRQSTGIDLEVVGARTHNLQHVNVNFPVGLLTVVTGVSGSGKSSLVMDTLLSAARARLYGSADWVGPCEGINGLSVLDKVVRVDQAPIGRTPRSSPATYTGLLGGLRELYAALPEARARGYKPGRFSFNVKGGRCEACQGQGQIRVEMHFLPDAYVTCDACRGHRYNRETLEVAYRGLSIADALELTVDEACDLFEAHPRLRQRLAVLREVGLGYVELGQSATTLSGGEAQRVKLAAELSKRATGRTLYVLDEPTTGLHFADIDHLMLALYSLRDAGNTVVIIEHNLDVIARADWVIDMGPGAGSDGGRVVAAGTPEEIASDEMSVTGKYLKSAL